MRVRNRELVSTIEVESIYQDADSIIVIKLNFEALNFKDLSMYQVRLYFFDYLGP
jgi:hypothetical protein